MSIAVKICGLTDERAVEAVIDAGANYAGFIHFPASPRHLDFARAAELKALLPSSVASVSVLVDPDDMLLAQSQSILKPDFMQLHGKETPDRVRAIKKAFPTIKIIKAIGVRSGDDVAKAAAYADSADMLMFDAKPPLLPLPSGEGRGEGKKIYANIKLINNARDLRKNITDAENLVWYFLRNRQFANYKFRRQHPVGNYILDFYCDELRLAIELDGSQHMENKIYDDNRTEFLNAQGITVMRFWNNDVLQNTDAVFEKIWNALPSPGASRHPLPKGEGYYLPGGNALSFDWALLSGREFLLPWFLSGGLNPHNVAEAVRITAAKMIDVSSGVESAPGVKDAALINAFVKSAKAERDR